MNPWRLLFERFLSDELAAGRWPWEAWANARYRLLERAKRTYVDDVGRAWFEPLERLEVIAPAVPPAAWRGPAASEAAR